jgi:putative membrane protein
MTIRNFAAHTEGTHGAEDARGAEVARDAHGTRDAGDAHGARDVRARNRSLGKAGTATVTSMVASVASIALLMAGGAFAASAPAYAASTGQVTAAAGATTAGSVTAGPVTASTVTANPAATGASGSVSATSTASGAGNTSYKKDQNIYGILSANGTSKNVYVVNQFKVSEAGKLTDYGDYDSVENLSTTKALTNSADEHSIDVAKGDFYYQGDLAASSAEAQLPWNIRLGYTLNGKKVAAKKLVGAKGRVGVTITTSRNKNSTEKSYYKKYMLQISFTVPTSDVSNIDAGDSGILADAGANKQITYTVMPGKDGNLSFTADVTDFSMSAISIAAAPFSMDLGNAFDTSSLTKGMEKLSDGVSELNDGATQLDSGTGTLASGASSLASGTGSLSSGLTTYAGGVATFANGTSVFTNGVSKLASGAGDLSSGAKSLNSGVSQYAVGVSELAKNSTKLSGGVQQLSDGLASTAEGSSGLASGLKSQKKKLEATANTTTLDAAARTYQTALTTYSQKLALTATTKPAALMTVQTVQKGLPDAVSDPAGYRSALVGAIAAQTDADVKTVLTDILNMSDAQTALTTLAGQAGSAETLSSVSDSVSQLDSGIQSLASGASTTAQGSQSFDSGLQKAAKAGSSVASGAKKYAAGVDKYAASASQLAGGTAQIDGGAAKLASGADSLASGAGKLSSGADQLADGVSQLSSGIDQLTTGISALNESTAQIPSTMKKEIDKAMESFSGTVTPVDFVSSRNEDVAQVQFMLTTSALEKTEKTKTTQDAPTPSFWQRLKNLFTGTKGGVRTLSHSLQEKLFTPTCGANSFFIKKR